MMVNALSNPPVQHQSLPQNSADTAMLAGISSRRKDHWDGSKVKGKKEAIADTLKFHTHVHTHLRAHTTTQQMRGSAQRSGSSGGM